MIKARCEKMSELRKLMSTPRFLSVQAINSISITLKRVPIHSERNLPISLQTVVKQDGHRPPSNNEMLATENTRENANKVAMLEPELSHGWEGLPKGVPHDAPMNTPCYSRRGAHVNVYVIDTGCRVTHEQLRCRAVSYPIASSPFTSGDDEVGHGTHIAATIVGRDLGLATSSRVVCVKAMSGRNSGSSANIISAINHVIDVTERYRRSNRTFRAAVLSISLGVQAPVDFTALDDAVTRAALAGIVPIVAAGNGGHDACTFTPARAVGAISVAALTANNHLAPFSNRGTCVAIAARGDSVASAYHKSDSAYALGIGTSIAVPIVSTMAALILGERPFLTPAQVLRELTRGHEKAHGIPIASLPACI
jgi:subtilisin family serine protease